jgi:regulator of nucleoside diphosphate kinase
MPVQSPAATRQAVITAADFDRLRHLVDSPRYRTTHAALLAALRQVLEQARVVTFAEVADRVVTMHSRLQVREPRAHQPETYTLVYPDEADIADGKLSVLAPLGAALLGAREGDTITFEAPAGLRRLRVEKILYQPEAAGDFHL